MSTNPAPALVLLLALAHFGCGDSAAAEEPAVEITAADRDAAKFKFDTLCFTCHGKTGGGDGPASVGLEPKPRDFRDHSWQQSVTDRHIEKIIVGGGAAVGKAVAMPSNPDLKGKPGVVAALREHIRNLGAQ